MTVPVDPARFWAYAAVTLVLCFTPGPANLFAIANGARRGRRAVVSAAVGMNTASLVWFAGAALGLGAVATAMPGLFRLLTLLGAGYVAWLGLQSILSARRAHRAEHPAGPMRYGAFRDGFAVQIANPKALLFITAILPPFLDLERPLIPQVAVFAAAGVGLDMLAMCTYGLGGAALAARMSQPAFRRRFDVFVGLLLIAVAALILLRG